MFLGGGRTDLRPGVVVVYQRRRVNARTSVAGTSITPDNRPTSVIVVVVHTLLVELLTGSGRCWQWRFDGRIQLLMDLLLVMLLLMLLLLVDEMLLLLLLLDDRSRCGRRGHGQQTLPVVANDLPLVLRILVRRPGHVAVAQGRWRRRMARTSGVAAAAAVAVTVVAAVMVVAVAVVVVVVRRMLVAAATVTLILDLGEEKVLLVAVLFRFAGAQMCVSDVGRNLRTGRVDDTTTLPGAFVDRLAGPSLPWQILVVVHADALVRVGERGRPGTANHNLIGGTVVVVTVTFATSVSIALVVAVVAIASVVAVVVVRWCGMSILAERWRRRAGAPRGAAAAGAGPQDGFPARRRRVGRAGQTHKYQGSVTFIRRVFVVNTVILPIVL